MDKFVINGRQKLQGRVRINGAKNSALKLMVATLLGQGEFVLNDVPLISDVDTMCGLLTALGLGVRMEENQLKINVPEGMKSNVLQGRVPDQLAKSMRASIQVMGPLLARLGWVEVAQPGGCAIGTRTLDIHLDSLRQMGATIQMHEGLFVAKAQNLKGADLSFHYPSVGATENIMMAATLAQGTTIIRNAAREPEIIDIQNFLNKMGAKITGAGTSIIKIEGVPELGATTHKVLPDRIEAGTYFLAFLITGGQGIVENIIPEHLASLTQLVKKMGVQVEIQGDALHVESPTNLLPFQIATGPYPSFPTDLQPQIVALGTQAQGVSRLKEVVFNQRFGYAIELEKLGAKIKREERKLSVHGPTSLHGATLVAEDLRGGAALVLAALAADGQSTVVGLKHIDRGYQALESQLRALGADIYRVEK